MLILIVLIIIIICIFEYIGSRIIQSKFEDLEKRIRTLEDKIKNEM